MKKFGIILVLVIVVSLVFPAVSFAAGPSTVQLPADVQILKKATLTPKGLPWMYDPLSPRRPVSGPKEVAASGILGRPVSGDRYAIVIGVTDYPGADMDLKYAANDAYDVRDTLVGVYGFPESNVELFVNGDARRSDILRGIAALKDRVGEEDEVLFFYSGHGAKSTPRQGPISEGIVLWGGEQPQPYVEFLWDKELRRAFDDFEAKRIVFAFDMCWAGGMNELNGPGRIVLGAVDRNGLAAEVGADEGFPEINNGLFTYFLFELGMGYGLADFYDNDGNPAMPDVTVEEAYDFARANLYQVSLQYQAYGLWEIPVIYDQFARDMLL
ncbi:MAG: caspase family protein [Dehalococcoidia bacterium]|nr:caspase family protein [Dehalococcoidia bacterium]